MRPQLTVAQDAQCSRCGKSETPAEDGPIRAESMAIGATADTPRVADRRHRLSAAGGDGVRRLSADSGRTPAVVTTTLCKLQSGDRQARQIASMPIGAKRTPRPIVLIRRRFTAGY